MSLTLVRDVFARASGLYTHHAALKYKGNRQVIEFDGFDKRGRRFHVESEPTHDHPMLVAAELGRQKAADMATVTGFRGLADTIRNQVAELKDKVAGIDHKMRGIAEEGNKLADDAKDMLDQAEAEIIDARAALGLTGNNGPE